MNMKTDLPGGYPTIYVAPEAPRKPVIGEACNGCGICCLVEPCPVGIAISGKRSGRCDALLWSGENARYLCGLVGQPPQVAQVLRGLSSPWRRCWALLAWPLSRMAKRWIAAGVGCDCNLEVDG